MHNSRRYLGLLAVLLALGANWLLPVLHAPCGSVRDDSQQCCEHENQIDAAADSHDHSDSPCDDNPAPGHDESRCGLCQIMFLGAIGAGRALQSHIFLGYSPKISAIPLRAQRHDSREYPRHLAPRGPPSF